MVILNRKMITDIIAVLVITLLVAYVIISFTGGPSTFTGDKATYDLQKNTSGVAKSSWTNRPSALRFAIHVQQAPRTLHNIDCVPAPSNGEQGSFGPSCQTYAYESCKCSSSTDCSNCMLSQEKGTGMSRLLWLSDFCELWASGYTSQNDKPYVPALLKIKTAKDSTNYYMESVGLPAIPLQTWTMITIVKEGRRIDVYYGAKQVASKLLRFIPVAVSESVKWSTGNSEWKGTIGFFNDVKGEWGAKDVKSDADGLLDTRGVPKYVTQMKMDIKEIQLPKIGCPFGDCNSMPDVTPPNPFLVYKV